PGNHPPVAGQTPQVTQLDIGSHTDEVLHHARHPNRRAPAAAFEPLELDDVAAVHLEATRQQVADDQAVGGQRDLGAVGGDDAAQAGLRFHAQYADLLLPVAG